MERSMAWRMSRRLVTWQAARRFVAFAFAASYWAGAIYAATPSINISQVPLTVTIPAHPQVVIAIGNSQSMDGTLAGAIMTGAGSLGAAQSLLQNSSSPVDFSIPTGFTPPVNVGSSGMAPYTVTCSSGSNLCDNSPSRLNVAKAAISAVLDAFMPDTDFALMDYETSSLSYYETWLYVMSPWNTTTNATTGQLNGLPFYFTSTQVAGDSYVANPCLGYTGVSTTNPTVFADCHNIATNGEISVAPGVTVATALYMQVSDSSDDPSINDVLYAPTGWAAPVCMVYSGANGPSPPDPWPYNASTNPFGVYSLADYNSNPGGVLVSYPSETNGCATETGPTNAGYVPYTLQTMYIARGFGYDATQEDAAPPSSPGYWAPLVPISEGTAGANPTTTSVNQALAYFTPFLAPETNSTGTTEIKAEAEQSPLAGLLANALGYYKKVNPASSNGCSTQRYVILLTDGMPTMDLAGHSWPPPGSAAATNYGVTVNFNADGSLDTSTTNDQAVLDTISTLTTMNNTTNNVKTYIIGLGAGVSGSTGSSVLKAMAIAGGTSNYYAATDPVTLAQDLNTILSLVQQATQAVAASAVNSTGVHVGSVAYQARFDTDDTNQDWTGNLFAFPINPTTGYAATNPSDANWAAQAQLDSLAYTARVIATWDPNGGTSGTGAGTPFEWTSGTTATQGIASSTTIGSELTGNPADTSGQDALNYLRGDRLLEQDSGGAYRTRTHVLADIVDSAPLYIGPPNGGYQGTSYAAFETAQAGRPPVVYVGANDGMLHAFDAATGIERFAFIPNAVFSNLINLTYPLYNENHRFFVDGSPEAWDVEFTSSGVTSWHTILVSGEGAGGKSMFALDVTNPGTITTESGLAADVLWEFEDSVNLGYTYGTPSLAQTNAGTELFFGNGYDSQSETPYLYVLNPQTGLPVVEINLCTADTTDTGECSGSAPNGLSSPVLVNSTGSLAGPANVLYAGDLQGNMWRIDISDSNPANWQNHVTLLYKAEDSLGNTQPITMQPLVSLNPDFPRLQGIMVFFGTGQLLSTSDLTNTNTQTVYGIFDAMPNSAVPTRTNLVQQTLSATTVTTVNATTVNARTISSNALSLGGAMKGWYVDLSLDPGERIVTEPALVNGALILTSNQPSGSLCVGGFSSWYYELNYMNGGTFPQPMFDVTESGQVSVTEPNVAGVSLGNVYASAPRVTSGSLGGGTASLDILVNESSTSTASSSYSSFGMNNTPACSTGVACPPLLNMLGRNGGKSRTAWWEIR